MIASRRRTLAREVELCGRGLHEGLDTRVRLLPAAAGAGIRFARVDLPGAPEVAALVRAREERPRRTALVAAPAEVHTVEHLLAAVGGAGITDLRIEIDRVEVPGLDGSSLDFARAIAAAGVADLAGAAPRLVLDRPIRVDGDGASILALPCPGRCVLEYHLDYGGAIAPARVVVEVTSESFASELCPARTFCLEREALALKAAGLGRGADTKNTLVIGDDGRPRENELRFPDECARHKALDLFGDLMLLGAALEARVIAYRSGHALNAALCRELRKVLDAAGERGHGHVGPGSADGAAACAAASAAASAATSLLEPGLGGTGAESGASGASGANASSARFLPRPCHFAGHFPAQPVLPGVISLAALEEATRGALAPAAPLPLEVEAVRFRRLVAPGEALTARVEPDGQGAFAVLRAEGGEVAAEGRFGYGVRAR